MIAKACFCAGMVVAALGGGTGAHAQAQSSGYPPQASDHVVRREPAESADAAKQQDASARVRYFPYAERGSVAVRFASDPKN